MVDGAALAAFSMRFQRPVGSVLKAHPGVYPGPDLPASWDVFATSLKSVGGVLLNAQPSQAQAIQAAIDMGRAPGRVVASAAAARLLTGVTGWETARVTTTPQEWEDVDLAIIRAESACAENAALLVTSSSLPERALAFLAQRILVLVPRNRLIGGFMAAQAELARRLADGEALHHATWMSGPSKTADIEQTLVIGAHGVCALAVMPVDA
ncbi:MAG: LUD domain-containing protein [Planctomycetes bacterium]|nr:LUD domain-containing protein [Planctomycetota bacterium]